MLAQELEVQVSICLAETGCCAGSRLRVGMEHERDMAKRPVDGPEMRIPDSFFKSPNLRLGQLTIGFLTGQRREGSEDHDPSSAIEIA